MSAFTRFLNRFLDEPTGTPVRKSPALQMDRLEAREVPAIIAAELSGTTLKIRTNDAGTDSVVNRVGNDIVVTENNPGNGFYLTAPTWKFKATKVSDIYFNGGDGRDVFVVNAFLPTEAWGDGGNDYLEGGNANDVLIGGEGRDTLKGYGGDDRLYGGDGVDEIYGGNGDDALYGGGEDSADTLWGGSGKDRFLTQATDIIKDGNGLFSRTGEDVQLRFVDGKGGSWSNTEIRIVDDAFQKLFDATGSNRLLRDSLTDEPLTFTQKKMDALGSNVDPVLRQERVETKTGPWYNPTIHVSYRTKVVSHRKIAMADWNENDQAENRDAVGTMLHEIGHNWDSAAEGNTLWGVFVGHSDWKAGKGGATHFKSGDGEWAYSKASKDGFFGDQVDTGRGFSLTYGKFSPYEDFASAWEFYFQNNQTTAHADATARAKLKTINKFVGGLG